jgi:hypothetical protein
MTVPHSWMLCYVREKEELRQQEKILRFFQKLAKHNCYVASTQEVGTTAVWRRFATGVLIEDDPDDIAEGNPNDEAAFASVLQPGVSEQVQQEIRVYAAELQESLTVEARLMARSKLLRGFEFTVTLAPGDGALLLSVNHERFFRRGQAGIMKFRYWVKLLQEIYAYWHPLFMHEFTHQGAPSANPTWEEVSALDIPELYPLNLFSPELVKKLGQERLAQAPAWMMETLDDEGVLLIPSDIYGFTPEKSFSFETVAQHLGFSMQERAETARDQS